MERRQHPRVPAQLKGFLLGNSHEIEAVTLDLSAGGARFDCDLEVYPGKMIRGRLVIPGAEEPVSIEEGRVQWVGEDMNSSCLSTNTKRQKAAATHNEMVARDKRGRSERLSVARLKCRRIFPAPIYGQYLTATLRKNIVSLWGEFNAPREYGS